MQELKGSLKYFTLDRIKKAKCLFFEKINRVRNPLPRFIKENKKNLQINTISKGKTAYLQSGQRLKSNKRMF